MSTPQTTSSPQPTILDRTKWPSCAQTCAILTSAEASCLPPQKTLADHNAYEDCFCRLGAPFNAYEYHKLCKEECGSSKNADADGDGDGDADLKKVTSCWEELCDGYLYKETKGLAWTSQSGWQSLLLGSWTTDWSLTGAMGSSLLAASRSRSGLGSGSIGAQPHPTTTITTSLSSPTFASPPVSIQSPSAHASRSPATTGAIIGIAVGSAISACALVAVVIYIFRRRKAQAAHEAKFELDGREQRRSELPTEANIAELAVEK